MDLNFCVGLRIEGFLKWQCQRIQKLPLSIDFWRFLTIMNRAFEEVSCPDIPSKTAIENRPTYLYTYKFKIYKIIGMKYWFRTEFLTFPFLLKSKNLVASTIRIVSLQTREMAFEASVMSCSGTQCDQIGPLLTLDGTECKVDCPVLSRIVS